MDPYNFHPFTEIKEGLEQVCGKLTFAKKQKEQPKFGYFQTSKLDKEQMQQIYTYLKSRIDNMFVSEFVSATEYLDIFSSCIDNFPNDEELPLLLIKMSKEKQFIDDIIHVYELRGSYILCPERYIIREELYKIWGSGDYNNEYLHAVINHGFITKEELFEFIPQARECFDNNNICIEQYFDMIRYEVQFMREHSVFAKVQKKQPVFCRLDIDYAIKRAKDMLESQFVSAMEFMDIFNYYREQDRDDNLIKLLQQIQKEKQFIDDFIEIYDFVDCYLICPDRRTIRRELERMQVSDNYKVAYFHSLINHGFITKDELFQFIPKARDYIDTLNDVHYN